MNAAWSALHFLRPAWLWALLAAPLVAWAWQARRQRRHAWRGQVDPHLLPHLLVRGRGGGFGAPLLMTVAYALMVLALAGPSWRQGEQPLWQSRTPLVVVLDLSGRIATPDLPPSRLLQVRTKLGRLLDARQGGAVALVVYADDAYTVSPLTEDAANVRLYLDDLAPEIMPVEGQRADRGIRWAARLLQQADQRQGDILLISDRADGDARAAASEARAQGFTVSALGVGTSAGAAYRSGDGAIGHAELDAASLRQLAAAGGGGYETLTAGDDDLAGLGLLNPALASGETLAGGGRAWRDEGYWLVLPVMLIALLAFRRGAALVVAGILLLPLAPPARAAEDTLWRRADQVRHERLEEGAQAYRRGDYAGAQRAFAGIDTPEGWYNLGNALAKQQRYDDAIAAYDRALRQRPGMEDAIANRAAVDAARKRPPSTGQGQGQGKGQDEQSDARGQDSAGAEKQGSDSAQGGNASPSSAQDASRAQDRSAPRAPPAPGGAPSPQPDATQQAAADAAQRERMRQAMGQAQGAQAKGEPGEGPAMQAESAEARERRQAVEAWLKRVPDEPGSLLKAKFRLEHERRRREGR